MNLPRTWPWRSTNWTRCAINVLVFNPWGIDNGSDKPGLVWLTWAEVTASYRSWSRSL
jgi:hypothetical protein